MASFDLDFPSLNPLQLANIFDVIDSEVKFDVYFLLCPLVRASSVLLFSVSITIWRIWGSQKFGFLHLFILGVLFCYSPLLYGIYFLLLCYLKRPKQFRADIEWTSGFDPSTGDHTSAKTNEKPRIVSQEVRISATPTRHVQPSTGGKMFSHNQKLISIMGLEEYHVWTKLSEERGFTPTRWELVEEDGDEEDDDGEKQWVVGRRDADIYSGTVTELEAQSTIPADIAESEMQAEGPIVAGEETCTHCPRHFS